MENKRNSLEEISYETMVFMRALVNTEEGTWGILPYVPMQYENRRIVHAKK